MNSKKQATRGHPAQKPTMDEYVATREQTNRARADFLKIDVETALTFVQIARESDNEVRQERNRQAARRAYFTVVRLMERTNLTEEDARTLASGLDRLKSELEQLGEVF